MIKVLSASEMKQVRGGAVSSSYCASGEKLYTCTSNYGNGQTSTGVVCSKSSGNAAAAVMDAHDAGTVTVTCN